MTWQPIETAPRNGTALLLHCYFTSYRKDERSEMHTAYWDGHSNIWRGVDDDLEQGYEYSHWQPLPEPPIV